jgi:hypothetical protein
MTENNNNSQNSNTALLDEVPTFLEVLDEVRDKYGKRWYDRVYLCYEDTNFKPLTTYGAIKGFNCHRYKSFNSADYAWNINKTEYKLNVRHTMIPICRWVPEIFDKYILNWTLRNMYWGGQIYIGRKNK